MTDTSATALAFAADRALKALSLTPVCVLDFETFSECDLKECGAWVYAQHPSTEILCMSWRLPGMPRSKIWVPSRGAFPQEVIDHIANGGIVEAHNAGFERAIWRHILVPKYGIAWPLKWEDTMATCAMLTLPQKLDEVGAVLGLKTQKDKRGKYLLSKLSKPQKPTKKNPETRCRDPQLLEELYGYCCTDIDTEWELSETIGKLPRPEYRIWVLDQKINDRGVYVDQAAVVSAVRLIETVEKTMTEELSKITGGMVQSGSELKKIGEWLATQQVYLRDLTADTIKRAVANPAHSELVRRVLRIRQILSKASIKKLYKYVTCVASDGRIHGLLQYHGAATGRWAGRLLQPQNFPRGDENLLHFCGEDLLEESMNALIEIITEGNLETIELVCGDPIEVIVSALRGMIVAAPGNQFYVADFAAIEARVTAWLYGEEWKLDAFTEIDAGRGYQGSDDVYCAAAAMVFGRPIKKKTDKPQRQVGKMCELAFGYQGGIGAWRNFDPREPGDKGYVHDDQVDIYKNAWRKAHPSIVSGWYGIEEAAVNTVKSGKPHAYSCVLFQIENNKAGKWLTCRLPNGRKLWYFNPIVDTYEEKDRYGRLRMKSVLQYEGRNNDKGGKWGVVQTYGGMLTENIVQAISRDLMVEAMIRVEQAGYRIILTVHDEIIAENIIGFGSGEEFDRLMTIVPDWAEGLPISVSGWVGFRYHKE